MSAWVYVPYKKATIFYPFAINSIYISIRTRVKLLTTLKDFQTSPYPL